MPKIVYDNRKCRWCGVERTITWHMAKRWCNMMVGFYCHTCYNCIVGKEERGMNKHRRKGKW